MKQLLVIHTGGTISMEEDQSTGGVFQSKDNPLLSQTEQAQKIANIHTVQPFHLPSPHIATKEMLQLKKIIEHEFKVKNIDGVVITHGTDTLEETAYFLDLTVNLNIPIVITGAMRSSNEIGSDGLYNFISSVRVACQDEAKDMGVLVVLNDEIHSARNVTKTHASNVSTFQSPQYGPVGIVTKKSIIFHHKPLYSEKYNVDHISAKVALIKAFAGMEPDLLVAISRLNYDGIVIEALGQGNLPLHSLSGIYTLIQANIPIVIVSRCFNGITQDIYSYEGGGKRLKEKGIIFSNGLNGQKARIKLMIALTYTKNKVKLEQIFSS